MKGVIKAGAGISASNGRQNGYGALAASRLLWRVYASSGLANRVLAALRPLIARFDRLVACLPDDGRVLEIGCGNGVLLVLLHRLGLLGEGVGIDINADAITAARRAARASDLPIEFHRGATLLDWTVEQFDIVMMVDVLHHVSRPLRRPMIEAALARVATGGLFIYKDMCCRPVLRRLWNQMHDLTLTRQFVSVEPVEHVLSWAAAAGFISVASERYVGAALYGHELEVFRRRAS